MPYMMLMIRPFRGVSQAERRAPHSSARDGRTAARLARSLAPHIALRRSDFENTLGAFLAERLSESRLSRPKGGQILPAQLALTHREAALLRRTLEYALENCAPDDEPVIANFIDRMDGDRGLEFEYEESSVLRDILQFAADTGPVGNSAVFDSLISKI